ncbi:MAG TPA: hypothetical protein VFV38_20420 [Ktedonobacteraceae bacterium]|nr:hypothetical protein [Ktedonobacteraceae bacterium]
MIKTGDEITFAYNELVMVDASFAAYPADLNSAVRLRERVQRSLRFHL